MYVYNCLNVYLPEDNLKMTLKELKKELFTDLSLLYPGDEANSLVSVLLSHVLKMSAFQLSLNQEMEISQNARKVLKNHSKELQAFKPIQYITGYTEFYNCRIVCKPGVLIPRPESEELVDWIVKSCNMENPRILDIGTGSGCLAIALAKHFKNAYTLATDNSETALEIARKNSKLNNVTVEFQKHDILGSQEISPKGSFHIILSNPPYVRESEKKQMKPNVYDWEPASALFVPDSDPLLYHRKITTEAYKLLSPGGKLFLEINENFPAETERLLSENKFVDIEIKKDIPGRYRMVKAIKATNN